MASKRYSGNWESAVKNGAFPPPPKQGSTGKYPSADPYPYGYGNVDSASAAPQYGKPPTVQNPPVAAPVAAPMAIPAAAPANAPAPVQIQHQPSSASSRSNSHRRRDTHGYQYPEPPMLDGANGRSYSQRLQAQPGLEDHIYRSQTKRPDYDDPVSPASPAERVSHSRDLIEQKYGRRKGSVPDRSPLQKLEVTLDDISKEEKRARVAEAEERAQRRASKDVKRSSGSVLKAQGYTPGVIDPYAQATRASSGKRISSAPAAPTYPAQVPDERLNPAQGYVPLPAPTNSSRDHYEPQQYQKPARPAKPEAPQPYSGQAGHRRSVSATQPANLPPIDTRQTGTQRYQATSQPQSAVEPRSPTSDRAASSRAAPALMAGATAAAVGTAAAAGRSNSKKLQKQAPESKSGGTASNSGMSQLQNDRLGKSGALAAAARNQEPDPLPRKQVLNNQNAGPKYAVPPQTAAAHQVHDQLGFGEAQSAQGTAPTQQQNHHGHHVGGMFHHEHGPERRYEKSRPLDEWRSAQTATLLADDMNLEGATPSNDRNSTWWEKNDKSSRRSSGSKTVAFDGAIDEPSSRQTYFQPPLYLKCGPLLRYCGLNQSQSSKGSLRETWRGSVLIVTDDTQSDTQSAPTLRLFVEPQDLIPPPPMELNVAEGQELASEYVDPLAGQVHMSRIGKTLYVRPVEQLPENEDLSRIENDNGLFEERRSAPPNQTTIFNTHANALNTGRTTKPSGEKFGKYREVRAIRLLSERNTTFWRFNIEVELGRQQTRIAYRINNGPSVGFWVPARGETMNTMFHSCNGFSLSVHSNDFCGPDPMWRDVLNCHQTKPFHVMIGGGDQIYNDAATQQTELFKEWCDSHNPHHKRTTPFSIEMQNEMEDFYLERYSMWFSQGLFGMANGQIPMVNMWDDHDIIDGFGSYPHHFMSSPVFCGVGAVAFKYYMLFQHQSLPDETSREEPSWLLGASPGPYIEELSRSLYISLGRRVSLLALDCRTERMKDEVLSQATYDLVFERLRREIVVGQTQHLIVLLGVPIAYPRLNLLENVLTSRAMQPVKALGRLGLFGGFLNKFDGGVEILDDLDDHWTAKHHKHERNWFIQELQELAAEKSVRVTILGGDVHLAAVGQFYSNKKLGIPKDQDHRYMPNIISSAIVNTPPPEIMGDVLNKRNKIHHLDKETDEDMIPLFTHDVDGKSRNNHCLLPRRNWCAIREYAPGQTPPPTPPETPSIASESQIPKRRLSLTRSLSLGRKEFTDNVSRRLSRKGTTGGDKPPPRSFFNSSSNAARPSSSGSQRRASDPSLSRPGDNSSSYFTGVPPGSAADPHPRPNLFHRIPTGLSEKAMLRGAAADVTLDQHINLQHGLDIVLNLEVSQHDPAGITTPYRLLVPALRYTGPGDVYDKPLKQGIFRSLSQRIRGRRSAAADRDIGYDSEYDSEGEMMTPGPEPQQQQATNQYAGPYAGQAAAAQTRQQPAPAPAPTKPVSQPIYYGPGQGGAPDTRAAAANGPPPARRASRWSPPQTILHQQPQVARANPVPRKAVAGAAAGAGARDANFGPDGRPVRRQYRGDVYDEEVEPVQYERHAVASGTGPGGMADETSSFDEEEEVPRESLGKRMMGRVFGGRRA